MTARTIIIVLLYCLCMALGVVVFLYQEASRWGFFDFSHLVHLAYFIFAVGAVGALVFDSVAAIRVPRTSAVAAVLCGILSASVLYSWVHGDIVLVALPSLFCAPGAIAGYLIADVVAAIMRRKATVAKAMQTPSSSVTSSSTSENLAT
jgi:hypothetical protein